MTFTRPKATSSLRCAAAILALPLVAWLPAAHADDAAKLVKNGVPCVAELCLGDGLAELAKIQWDRAKNPFSKAQTVPYSATRKLSAGETRRVSEIYRGDTAPAGAYLYDKMFDSESLGALARVKVACEQNELIGTYTTKGGNPTRVGIILTPDLADAGKQQWTVVSINRTFPAAVTNEQRAEVEQQLVERYHAFGAKNPNIRNAKAGEGRFFFTGSPFGFHLTLSRGYSAEVNRMKQHPECGGAKKISVD